MRIDTDIRITTPRRLRIIANCIRFGDASVSDSKFLRELADILEKENDDERSVQSH